MNWVKEKIWPTIKEIGNTGNLTIFWVWICTTWVSNADFLIMSPSNYLVPQFSNKMNMVAPNVNKPSLLPSAVLWSCWMDAGLMTTFWGWIGCKVVVWGRIVFAASEAWPTGIPPVTVVAGRTVVCWFGNAVVAGAIFVICMVLGAATWVGTKTWVTGVMTVVVLITAILPSWIAFWKQLV